MADRTVSVSLVAKMQGFVAGISTAGRATKQFGGELEQLGKTSPKRLHDITAAMGGTGLALLAIGGYAAKAAADFDKQMSHVDAVAQTSAGQLDQLRAAALKAGKETSFSATEAAKAEEELAKAGISTADILGGALDGSLALASAGSLDLAEAADIAAKAMNTFQLTGRDVGHIADVLSASANKSATDVHEMGEALKMGGLAARNSGLSLEQTVGTLSAFADRALVGSDAGTSLKTMLQFLANPTEKSAALMDALGISVYDTAGNFVGITKVADILQQRLGTLTQEQRNAALATIFGADATRAATVLYELGADGVQKYVDAVDDSGAAAETARKKTDNLAGDIERLHGSIETLAIEAGSGANGGLRKLVQTLDGLVGLFSSLPGPVQSTIVVLAAVGGAGLLATAGLLKVRQTGQEALAALSGMGPQGEKAAKGLSAISSVGAKIGLAGVAIFGLYEGFKALGDWISSFSDPTVRSVDKMTTSLKEFADTGKISGELASTFGKDMSGLARDLDKVTQSTNELAAAQKRPIQGGRGVGPGVFGEAGNPELARQARENIGALDKSLADMANNGGATQAKLALEQLRTSGHLTEQQFNELIGQMPLYSAATNAAALSNTGLAKGFGDTAANAHTMAGSLEEATQAGQSLIDVFNQLNGAQLNVNETTIAAEQAVDDLTESIKKNKGSLDLSTEAGRSNQQALDELAKKAAAAAQAVYEQTGSASAASATFEVYRQAMINAYLSMGKSRTEAELLTSQLMALPKSIPINVTVTTTYRQNGTPSAGNSRYPGINSASGNVIDYYGRGGISDGPHNAMVAPAGSWRTFGEPETGGEGYIPLSAAKRNQSIDLLKTINRRFGDPIGGGGPRELILRLRHETPDGRLMYDELIRWASDRGQEPLVLLKRRN